MAEVVICELMDEQAVEYLRRHFDVLYDPDLGTQSGGLRESLGDCRALIVRNYTKVDGCLLKAAPRLVVVGRLGVGMDNIDMDVCALRGITVLRASGANALAVAEYVIGGLFLLFRGAYHATPRVIAGEWPRARMIGREISGKRLGLVGFGMTARQVAVRAKALGMEVCASDRFVSEDSPLWHELGVERVTLDALLTRSDAVSIHVPLTSETRHLIDRTALSKMSPHAVLVNAARGEIVDETSLVEALKRGAIAGALLDVFNTEPLLDGRRFEGLPNVILTPHIAGLTRESNVRVSQAIAEDVRRHLLATT